MYNDYNMPPKKGFDAQISLRLPVELKERYDTLAKMDGKSTNEFIVSVLIKEINDNNPDTTTFLNLSAEITQMQEDLERYKKYSDMVNEIDKENEKLKKYVEALQNDNSELIKEISDKKEALERAVVLQDKYYELVEDYKNLSVDYKKLNVEYLETRNLFDAYIKEYNKLAFRKATDDFDVILRYIDSWKDSLNEDDYNSMKREVERVKHITDYVVNDKIPSFYNFIDKKKLESITSTEKNNDNNKLNEET